MMKYVLLDTNVLIYREGEKVLDKDVQTISRLLMDSDEFRLCIHPLSIKELAKHKDEKQRNVILSKVNIYNELENPPIITEEFNETCGGKNNEHELIDNNLLYSVYKNCVSYLITNDKGIIKKSKKFNLEDRVLTISKAIALISKNTNLITLKTPPIVQDEFLYNVDLEDEFFDILKMDYDGFDKWFEKKQLSHDKAKITYKADKKIGAFLLLKIEDELEDYGKFEKPFDKNKRIKISTFKVEDNGKAIGEAFIKIAIDYALGNNINELYVTIFDKYDRLIDLFKEYGFELYTHKETLKQDGTKEKEGVYLKILEDDKTNYPIIKLKNQKIYILPIQNEFAHMLFPDLFDKHQLSLADLEGTSTYSNVIKKAYISKSNINPMNKNDILVFYASQIEQSIVCVGVVDDAFRANEIASFEVFEEIVRRRTVYTESYLREVYNKGYLIILFKYYVNLPEPIFYKKAMDEGIIKGAPQSIHTLDHDKFKKIVKISGSQRQIKI